MRAKVIVGFLVLAALAACGPDILPPAVNVAGKCERNSDCATKVCDIVQGRCVECETAADCGTNRVCIQNKCDVKLPCQSSKQCDERICSTDLGWCVDCLTSSDCGAGKRCVQSSCISLPKACTGTKDCTGHGLVCDPEIKACAECSTDTDCLEAAKPLCGPEKKCLARTCTPKSAECVDSGKKRVCNDRGDAWTEESCGSGKSCDAGECKAQVCKPFERSCDGNVSVACKADGLATERIDCTAVNKLCRTGECVEPSCGDGTKSGSEECDDGNQVDTDTCRNACNLPKCGDGVISTGEACDGGANCKPDCTLSTFPSCAAIKAANAAATDGLYDIDPDGSGPVATVKLFCDMTNGGLTLVANIYDSAGDDAPNSTDFVVSGWQQTASGQWNNAATKVEKNSSGTGSAAVSLAFVAALKAGAGQQNLKMCFVHQNGADTTCRNTADGSMTLVSYPTGNPKLTVYSGNTLPYTYGRLAGLAGSVDNYDPTLFLYTEFSVQVTTGSAGEFGGPYPGGTRFGEHPGGVPCGDWDGVWATFDCGISFRPYCARDEELGTGPSGCTLSGPNPSPTSHGFRLYVGP